MKQIEKLDTKYFVFKTEDLDRFFSQYTKGIFTTPTEQRRIDTIPFNTVCEEILKDRKARGKTENNYLVLNLDDEIDFEDLEQEIITLCTLQKLEKRIFHVRDVAVDLVNAILKAKDAQGRVSK